MSFIKTSLRRCVSWQAISLVLFFVIATHISTIAAQGQKTTVESVKEDIENIKIELSQAECGGWIPFDSMDNYNIANYIATTNGVPGRNGITLGDVTSGMAPKEESFIFPNEVIGISTACRPGNPPFLEEHACQRPAGQPVFGNGSRQNTDPLENGVTWTCNALGSDINRRWKKERWTTICPGIPPATYFADSGCYDVDTEAKPQPPQPPNGCATTASTIFCCTNSPSAPNVVACQGAECRGEQSTVTGFTSLGDPYISYYRQYNGSCQRSKFPEPYVKNDTTYERLNVPVSCYGFYNEYDPYNQVSTTENLNCVIANTYDDKSHDFMDAPSTQRSNMSAVEYGINMSSVWIDPPPGYTTVRQPQNELWHSLNGGFSLTKKETLEKDYNNDITYALLSADNAKMHAYPQLSLEQPVSSGALLRAFDETKTPDADGRRYFTEWWQEVQTEMDQLLSPPKIRLVLPHAKTIGLDRNDPFITKNLESIQPASGRQESVEILLQASEDLLGELADYLERSSLLQVQEEEIPLVVPFASPVELRALADSWCTWFMESSGKNECDSAPSAVKKMQETLNDYADSIDSVRELRSELYHYESALLEQQANAIRVVHDWIKDVVPTYQAYLDSIGNVQSIRDQWQATNDLYAQFYDKTNMPWCMNQRFTTPIYSLLDQWYPGRPQVHGGIDTILTTTEITALPRINIYPPQTDSNSPYDVYIDLSHFFVADAPIKIPVLKPIQVRLDWSVYTPPELNGSVPTDLPELPPIPTIFDEVEKSWPEIKSGNAPSIITTYFPEVENTIDPVFMPRVQQLLQKMTERYEQFWQSLQLDPKDVDDGTEEDCITPGEMPCVHVEMDLKERFQRMCARPAVLMKEDFAAMGHNWISPATNDYDTCPREDWSCQLLWRSEVYGQKGWALLQPKESTPPTVIDNLRKDMFYDTLLQPGVSEDDKLKFMVQPSEILPSLGIPHTGSLLPTTSQQ